MVDTVRRTVGLHPGGMADPRLGAAAGAADRHTAVRDRDYPLHRPQLDRTGVPQSQKGRQEQEMAQNPLHFPGGLHNGLDRASASTRQGLSEDTGFRITENPIMSQIEVYVGIDVTHTQGRVFAMSPGPRRADRWLRGLWGGPRERQWRVWGGCWQRDAPRSDSAAAAQHRDHGVSGLPRTHCAGTTARFGRWDQGAHSFHWGSVRLPR